MSPAPRKRKVERFGQAAAALKVLAHPVRLRLLELIHGNPSLTVGDLARELGLPQHHTSQHLKLMRASGLLRAARDGRCVRYAVALPALVPVLHALDRLEQFKAEYEGGEAI